MGTAYIQTCITAEINGVTLFQIECAAEIDYEVDAGALADWSITDFIFEEHRSDWDSKGSVYNRRKVAEVSCPDILRPTLMHYVDQDRLRDDLINALSASGEMYSANGELARDYHASVL